MIWKRWGSRFIFSQFLPKKIANYLSPMKIDFIGNSSLYLFFIFIFRLSNLKNFQQTPVVKKPRRMFPWDSSILSSSFAKIL